MAADVEAKAEAVDMVEDVAGEAGDGALADDLEHAVPEIVEQGGAETRADISERKGEDDPDRGLGPHGIDDRLVGERDDQGDALGEKDEQAGESDPQAGAGIAARPEVGQEAPDGSEGGWGAHRRR